MRIARIRRCRTYGESVVDLQLDIADLEQSASGRRAAVEGAIRSAIRAGRLTAHSALPSTRSLAADLGVSRSTVVAAYEQLAAEGYLIARRGSATRVAAVQAEMPVPDEPDPMGPAPDHDFRPGEPDLSAFPRSRWQRSFRRVLTESPDASFGYPDPRGAEPLRVVLSEYLARTRTVHANASAVQVCGGFGAALGFVGEALRRRGIDHIATEDPMLPFHADILRTVGVTTVPVQLDREGMSPDGLAAAGVRAALVTPAHQYPMGITMSAERRAELAAWATAVDGWIVEDDYDGEFRYDRRPIGSVQGLAPERVVYAGTASKSLGPALRLAWLVVPEALRRDLLRVARWRVGVSAIDQLVLADFIGRGDLDRQVRQMRGRYRDRHARMVEMLAAEAPWLVVEPTPAGLHLAASIGDSPIDESTVLDTAREASVGLFGLHTHHRTTAVPPGFAIGFSRPAEHHFPTALARLATALRATSGVRHP